MFGCRLHGPEESARFACESPSGAGTPKKLVIADNVALIANKVFSLSAPGFAWSGWGLWPSACSSTRAKASS